MNLDYASVTSADKPWIEKRIAVNPFRIYPQSPFLVDLLDDLKSHIFQ
jgi:hypothetical protein